MILSNSVSYILSDILVTVKCYDVVRAEGVVDFDPEENASKKVDTERRNYEKPNHFEQGGSEKDHSIIFNHSVRTAVKKRGKARWARQHISAALFHWKGDRAPTRLL